MLRKEKNLNLRDVIKIVLFLEGIISNFVKYKIKLRKKMEEEEEERKKKEKRKEGWGGRH